MLKEFQDHDMFLDELMHHADANDLTKPARRAYSFAKSFIVMELGPRKDLECELKRHESRGTSACPTSVPLPPRLC